jgi:hypothetical protein
VLGVIVAPMRAVDARGSSALVARLAREIAATAALHSER